MSEKTSIYYYGTFLDDQNSNPNKFINL